MKIVTKTDGSVDANYKYEPYGKLLADKSTGTDITKYKYTGQEEDSGTGLYNYSTRFYDPEIGRFISPDSMVPDPGDTQAFNRYMYANNNPVRFNDPTGHYSEEGGADPGDYTSPYQNQPTYNYTNNTANSSNYTNYSLFNFNFNNYNLFQNTAKTNENLGTWRTESPWDTPLYSTSGVYAGSSSTFEENTARNIADGDKNCRNCLDPSTIGKNLLGLSYPGPNNPLTYSRDNDYSYVPSDLSEYPAIGHDRRYDNLKINGLTGLLTDTRAIGADWRFVAEELCIAVSPFSDPISRNNALVLTGLGVLSLPKTIYTLTQPNGLAEIILWYRFSNIGVTNLPDSKNP